MKIAQIVGARPQFVKLAPLSREVRKHHEEIIIHSGQHYDLEMNEVFFRDLAIASPDYNLNIGSGSHGVQTAGIITALEPVLQREKPDWVIVYGDTNTTLAGALTAVKLGIPTAHVEACLRSHNRSMPEEINRIVADHICNLLFAPTQAAWDNAKLEALTLKCRLVGDIMVDSIALGKERAGHTPDVLQKYRLSPESYLLLTLHRPFNVDDAARLQHILSGLNALGRLIIFPVHPRTYLVMKQMDCSMLKNIRFIEPQSYLDFLALMANAERIVTDSGGIQKEAYIIKKPCVTLRTETEWVETVELGWNLLLSIESATFPDAINSFTPPAEHPDIFGHRVAEKIVKEIEEA